MNTPFYEQVSAFAGRFESWGACERTVVLVALLRRLPWPGVRLIERAAAAAVERGAATATEARERRTREDAANDVRFLRAAVAAQKPASEVLRLLVAHLPLLRPGNEDAKHVYLGCVPHLVRHCVAAAEHLDRCQEMLSYLLIHPALTDADKRSLKQWLVYLEHHILNPGKSFAEFWSEAKDVPKPPCQWPSNGTPTFRRTIGKNVEFKSTVDEVMTDGSESVKLEENLQESFSKNGKEVDVNGDIEKNLFDSAIIQPKARRSNSLTPPSTSETLNIEQFMQKPRSFSLSSEHSLLNVQTISNLSSSSGSETRLDDLRFNGTGDHDGMSTVAQWLKSLRLHKYIWLFSNISYDQMMAIDEDYLQRLGVTKGARHKLLLSIRKLSERQNMLEDMERELSNGSFMSITSMTSLLEQLQNIVISPIKPESPLAALVVRVLDLASARILSSGSSYHDGGAVISRHCWLVDRALTHDAFSRSAALAAELKSLKYRVPPRQFLAHLGDASFQRRSKPRWRNWNNVNNWQPNENNRKSSSYPSFPSTQAVRRLPPAVSMGDINSRLESLCLQMTEQAIN